MRRLSLLGLVVLLAACASEEEQAPAGPRVFFASPEDGATVTSPVQIDMAAEGLEIRPAGSFEANTGHFHIIVNHDYVAAGSVIPADSTHIHYGDGSTSTQLDLPSGEHVLRLQLADGAHIAMEGLQDQITVRVQ